MVKLIALLLFFGSFISIIMAPWFTAVVYFLNGIMQPKYVWSWTFPVGTVQSKYLAMFAILALMKAMATQKVDTSIYRYGQNYMLLGVWILFHLSETMSTYPDGRGGTPASIVLSALNTIIIMYFVGLGLLSDVKSYKKALLYMSVMFAYVAAYYSFWANDLYFNNRWDMFFLGRLEAPRGSSIGDQNGLSTLVVMGMPFILLGFFYCQSLWKKVLCIGILPLLWHALFLWGSRGAMLTLIIATLIMLRMLKPTKTTIAPVKFQYLKSFKIVMVVGFVVAVMTQGAAMMERSTETAQEAKSGDSDEPLNPRLVSWAKGIDIALEYPFLGAGPQRFIAASAHLFPEASPHVAHNTFVSFGANTGLLVLLLILCILISNYKNYKYCLKHGIQQYPLLDYLNKCCALSLISFCIGGFFLDLIIFEAFYFILMLNLAKLHMFKKLKSQEENINNG